MDLLTPNALKQAPEVWKKVKEDLIYVTKHHTILHKLPKPYTPFLPFSTALGWDASKGHLVCHTLCLVLQDWLPYLLCPRPVYIGYFHHGSIYYKFYLLTIQKPC